MDALPNGIVAVANVRPVVSQQKQLMGWFKLNVVPSVCRPSAQCIAAGVLFDTGCAEPSALVRFRSPDNPLATKSLHSRIVRAGGFRIFLCQGHFPLSFVGVIVEDIFDRFQHWCPCRCGHAPKGWENIEGGCRLSGNSQAGFEYI